MIDVLRVLDDLGIEYRVSGDEATACCPNPKHRDHSPSWSINLDTGKHNCFACNFSGPLVRLVRTLRSVSDEEAELWVRTRGAGRLWAAPGREEAPEEDDRPAITEASLALFTDPPSRELDKRRISRRAAGELGILWNPGNRAWILPFRDADGKLHGWQEKETRGERYVRNYPKGLKKSQFLFGLHAAAGRTAIVVESPLDVARLRSAGVRGAVSSYGVRVSHAQLSLTTARFDSVVFALDNDEAGWEVSEKIRKEFHSIPVSFFNYDGCIDEYRKDPGEMDDWEIEAAISCAIPALVARF